MDQNMKVDYASLMLILSFFPWKFRIKRYGTDKLDDHWTDIPNKKLEVGKSTRAQILRWGPEVLKCMLSSRFSCFKISFRA